MELRALVAIVVGFFIFWMVAAIPIIFLILLILRHRQRMAMIEKGIAPQPKPPQAHLKRGLILSFTGGSLILAWVIWLLLHILNL